ncbi:enoyl-CoA hydratase-related protein [Paraburkholderia fungorum]|uniref:enoyl-CoA hydratase-related protein n=1 Tax=Paraburkholderia fungorum TaxID=134537 RepID=UPI002098507A|nr:enoyl-CoA hydratase-related protein [Paraburkholderia fungorum]USX06623.1 enoyl-CoA hydratase-related protein [Paraburkholderia fungorum]
MVESVITTRKEDCLLIQLNRPTKHNAFTIDMHDALLNVIRGISSDPGIRCVILTGVGKAFCAGQDLVEASTPSGPIVSLGDHLDKHYNPLILALRSLPVPVIAAVNGVAAGAGASLALACDIVIATRSARFVMAFAKLGLIPDAGATWLLPRLVGPMRARAMILLGEAVDAQTAKDWGLVWSLFDDDADLMSGAMKLAERLVAMPASALSFSKQALNCSSMTSLDDQLNIERDLQSRAGDTPNYREAVAAFLEGREPQFSGRQR